MPTRMYAINASVAVATNQRSRTASPEASRRPCPMNTQPTTNATEPAIMIAGQMIGMQRQEQRRTRGADQRHHPKEVQYSQPHAGTDDAGHTAAPRDRIGEDRGHRQRDDVAAAAAQIDHDRRAARHAGRERGVPGDKRRDQRLLAERRAKHRQQDRAPAPERDQKTDSRIIESGRTSTPVIARDYLAGGSIGELCHRQLRNRNRERPRIGCPVAPAARNRRAVRFNAIVCGPGPSATGPMVTM